MSWIGLAVSLTGIVLVLRLFWRTEDAAVTPDPQSVREAEERELNEKLAGSEILSIKRTTADELRRQEFWRQIEGQRKNTVLQMRKRG